MITFRFFIHPHVVIKYYLLSDIKKAIQRFGFEGQIVDIGCGKKPYKKLFTKSTSYTGIDFQSHSKNQGYTSEDPDIYFPSFYAKTYTLPFRKNTFDHAVSFQVLEHHKNPQKMIREMVRIVKPNGYILVSFPFIFGLHEQPKDYYRFTMYSVKDMFKQAGCRIVSTKKQGSICSTLSTLLIDYLTETSYKNIALYSICVLAYPVFLFLAYSCFFFDKIFLSEKIFLNYLIVAKKI